MPRGARKVAQGKITVKGIGGKKIEIPLCEAELKSKWKTGLITVGEMDSLPLKGISLLLRNDVGDRTTFPRKRTKLNATTGQDRTKRRKNLSGAQDLARRNMPEPQDKMKKKVDRKTGIRKFQEGDKGLLLSSNREPPLSERFQGPYTVARKTDSINYKVNIAERRKKTQVYYVKKKKKGKRGSSESTNLNDKEQKWRR